MPGDRLQVWNPDENRWIKYIPSEAVDIPWWVQFTPKKVIFMDDMEGILKWEQHSGTVTKVSDIHAFEGSNSLSLVTGGVAGNQAEARQYFANLRETKYKIGMWWHAANALVTTLRLFDIQLHLYTGTHYYYISSYYYNRLTVDKHYWTALSGGVWRPIPYASEVIHTDGTYHGYFELGFDLSSERPKFTSFKSNALKADISSFAPHKIADTTLPFTMMALRQVTDVNVASTVYVDALALAEVD